MKTVTLSKLRASLGTILRQVAQGEEIEIVEERKPLARLVPPAAEETDWSETFNRLDEIWGAKPLSGKPGSDIVTEGRR